MTRRGNTGLMGNGALSAQQSGTELSSTSAGYPKGYGAAIPTQWAAERSWRRNRVRSLRQRSLVTRRATKRQDRTNGERDGFGGAKANRVATTFPGVRERLRSLNHGSMRNEALTAMQWDTGPGRRSVVSQRATKRKHLINGKRDFFGSAAASSARCVPHVPALEGRVKVPRQSLLCRRRGVQPSEVPWWMRHRFRGPGL